jgi:hypothetical protein
MAAADSGRIGQTIYQQEALTMQCFTITGGFDQPTVQPWVDVQDQHIILGEAGRGRSRALVPIPAAAEIEHETRLVQIRDHAGLATIVCPAHRSPG